MQEPRPGFLKLLTSLCNISMKKISQLLLSAAMVAFCLEGNAALLTRDEAASKAAAFLQRGELNEPVSMQRVKGLSGKNVDEQVYFFNASEGGYVIVNANDKLPAILGYSTEGCIDLNNLPDGLLALLEMNAAAAESNEEMPKYATTSGSVVVSPLLGKIAWGQDDPFNAMCPTDALGKPYYVGCVATAATQIMRYYQYPPKGTGSKSYTMNGKTLSADFGNTVYDWANMPETVGSDYTAAQKTALATLAYHFGVAVEMTYESGGSAATSMMVSGALRNYFGYSPSTRMHPRNYYNSEDWLNLIKKELDNGHPVYYAASSDSGAGGHAFVCDGYDSNDYVHINWGWTGNSNGYFLINHMNPGSLGIGGGSGGYNLQQEIVTDFIPSTQTALHSPEPSVYQYTLLTSDMIGNGISMYTYVANYDVTPFNGQIAAVLCKDGEIVKIMKELNFSINGYTVGGAYQEYLRMVDVPVTANVSDGTYQLKLAYKDSTMADYKLLRHPIGSSSGAEVTVKNGSIIRHDRLTPAPDVTVVESLSPINELHANGSAVFNARIRNNSSDFKLSNIVLRMQSVNDPSIVAESENAINIYDMSEEAVRLSIVLPEHITEGDYDVWMYHKGYADKEFDDSEVGRCRITVLPEATYPIMMLLDNAAWTSTVDLMAKTGDITTISMQVQNFGAEGDGRITVRLQDEYDPQKNYVYRQSSTAIEKNAKSNVNMGATLYVSPGVYTPMFYYVDSDLNEHDAGGNFSCEPLTVMPNDNLMIEVLECDMPTYLEPGKSVPVSVKVRALQTFSRATFYFRLRPFTLTDGELATMQSNFSMNAGDERTISFNYRPGSALAQTFYVPIIEVKNSQNEMLPAANYDAYYREIGLGVEAGVENVTTDTDVPSITFDGTTVIAAENDALIELYNAYGTLVSSARGSVTTTGLPMGIYIVRVNSSKGYATKKIVVSQQ